MAQAMNLFAPLPAQLPREVCETLAESSHVRIERILSQGQASPAEFWYDQDQAEFVIVLQGAARLQIEGHDQLVTLCAGDYIDIRPHQRHRVDWTAPDKTTVWLAVYYG